MCSAGHAAHVWRRDESGALVCERCGALGVEIIKSRERAREIAAEIVASLVYYKQA